MANEKLHFGWILFWSNVHTLILASLLLGLFLYGQVKDQEARFVRQMAVVDRLVEDRNFAPAAKLKFLQYLDAHYCVAYEGQDFYSILAKALAFAQE